MKKIKNNNAKEVQNHIIKLNTAMEAMEKQLYQAEIDKKVEVIGKCFSDATSYEDFKNAVESLLGDRLNDELIEKAYKACELDRARKNFNNDLKKMGQDE